MAKKLLIYAIILGILIGTSTSIIYNYINKQDVTALGNVEQQVLDIDNLFIRSKEYYYKGQLEEAVLSYQDILKQDKNNINALENIIIIEKELGNYKSAVSYINRLIALSEDKSFWKYNLGIIKYQMGKMDESKEILSNLHQELTNNDDNIDTTLTKREISILYYYLANIYQQNNQYQKSKEFFEKGIDLNQELVLNYIGLAKLEMEYSNYDRAIELYRLALKKDSSLSFLYPDLARSYEMSGEDRAAYYYWQRSKSTGKEVQLANTKIKELDQKHPEYKKNDEEEKEKARTNIKWANIKPIDNVDNIPVFRVGLVDKVNDVKFQVSTDFIIKSSNDETLYHGKKNTEYKINYYSDKMEITTNNNKNTLNTKDAVIIKPITNNATFMVYDISYGSGYFWAGSEDRQYRGSLEIYPLTNNSFNLINLINLEEYLFSVVPAEMPAWWPMEALKAQTIAARSYALTHLGKHAKDGYDLCDTVHCAAYNGVSSETNRSNQAVLETLGQVADYNGKIIDAVFSSNSGGYSEKSEEIWGHKLPYLTGANNMINQDLNFPLEPFELEQWIMNSVDSYSANPRYAGYNKYRWVTIISADYLKEKYKLDNINNILSLDRSNGGSIGKILIIGQNKTVEITKDRIRSGLGGLKSNRFTLKKIYSKKGEIKSIIIYGSGWGHNVGMDQTGAAGMADEGNTYQEIIKHFYPGVTVRKIPTLKP